MNIIRDIDSGRFLATNGMTRNGYTPGIAFGMKPTWEISWVHADGSAVDLSGVVAWSAAIDNDYRDDTQVMCRTVAGITADGHTTIVPLNANTVTYRAKVTGKASIAAIFQLKGFDANGATIFLQKFPVLAGYDIDPDMEGDPEEVPSGEGLDAADVAGIAQTIVDQAFANYTPPQTPGPTGPAPILQYSATAIAWHSTWQDGDLYARISSDKGETWGPAMRWGAGQVALPEIVVYDPAEVYVIGQVVTYGDHAGVYQCIEDANYSQSPESHADKWRLVCAPGATGLAGATWLSASGVPDAEAGVDGDNYLDLDTYNHYFKSGGAWIQRGCLRGQNGAGIVWRGAWSAEATYLAGDAVSKAGSLWRAVAAHTGQEPPADPTTPSIAWEIFLARGEQGLPGTTGTIQIAGINILSPTADPYASEAATSTPQRRLYILNIPRGSTGPAGQLRITMGPPLEPEDDPTLIEHPTSTPYSRVYQLRVPMGPKGEPGTGLYFNAAGPLADRVNYDAAAPGFVFAATDILTDDTGAHYQAMYHKRSATFADWSDPLRLYVGAKGEPGVAVKGDPGIDGNAAYAKPDHEFTELDLVDRAVVIPGTTPVASVELFDQFGHAHALTLGSSASSQAAITYRADINTTLALIANGEDVTYGGRVRFAQSSAVYTGRTVTTDIIPIASAAADTDDDDGDADTAYKVIIPGYVVGVSTYADAGAILADRYDTKITYDPATAESTIWLSQGEYDTIAALPSGKDVLVVDYARDLTAPRYMITQVVNAAAPAADKYPSEAAMVAYANGLAIKAVTTLPATPIAGQMIRLTAADDTAKAAPGVYMHDGAGWTCISYEAAYALGNLGATPSLSLIPGASHTATVDAEITSFTVAFSRPGLASITLTNASTLAVAQPAMTGRTSKLLAEGAWDGAATALSKALIEDDGTYIIVSAGGLA